ncbi:OLC1v1009903C1 [Oldenlandia corymbosa var. corymbosa]|uniref:OLC1v1009903C1 n=1 Tax=Oldenlandia corymbosa var. corymbosa TaxID=529605 RepID=A0AAV1DQ86_OLDCO|nr:OLC1v1009903C1 [Oldenlandia corymbosa var. corymbosa]
MKRVLELHFKKPNSLSLATIMKFSEALLFLVILLPFFAVVSAQGKKEWNDLPSCDFPAIYNFGDSNSDTGGAAAAFFPRVEPQGVSYFHRPAGRVSDGRLIIDFIAEHLGLPLLSAYLDSIGTSFRHGANFAVSGTTIQRLNESWFESGIPPFPLDIQVEHYNQFKNRTAYFYNLAKKESDINSLNRLPRPQDFSRSLYTIDMGQNDIALGFRQNMTKKQKQHIATLPAVIEQFALQIRSMYAIGARVFWIHNTGPYGCLPYTTWKIQDRRLLDEHGCYKSRIDAANKFNRELKLAVIKLRAELTEAAITYVDMFRAKHELIIKAKELGFEDPFNICCGIHGLNYDVGCGGKGIINGTLVYAGSCTNPSKFISWDGLHYTEAANRWIASHLVNGSFSDPPIPITRACHRHI